MRSNKAVNAYNFRSINGIVSLKDGLHVKSAQVLKALFEGLKEVGYRVKNLHTEANRNVKTDRTGVLVGRNSMKQQRLAMWRAELNYEVKGKCGTCKQYINSVGVNSNGNKCELCGAVTYYLITQGSCIRFSFIPAKEGEHQFADICMYAYRWFPKSGNLYLYPNIQSGNSMNLEKTIQYFHSHSDKWKKTRMDGKDLIQVKYKKTHIRSSADNSTIEPYEITKHYFNGEVVYLWQGKEYTPIIDRFPVPESIDIFEDWN